MAAATARPGTDCSRPLPTPPTGVYGAVMTRAPRGGPRVVPRRAAAALHGQAPGRTGRPWKDRPPACPLRGPSVAPTAAPHRGAAPRSIGRGEPARVRPVRAGGRPSRAGGGGAGTRRSGRAHADATHAEGRVGKRTAGGEDSRAPTPFPLPSSPTLTLPPPCPATCRAAPRAAQPVTVVVGAGLGRAAMSRRTS